MLTLKLAGQKADLMTKLRGWIEENVEDLYQKVDHQKLAKYAAQQEALRRHAVTKQLFQKKDDEFYKDELRKNLLLIAERIITIRQKRLRNKRLERVRYKVRPDLEYEIKKNYLENSIEHLMLYFKVNPHAESNSKFLLDLKEQVNLNEIKIRLMAENK